MNRGIVSAAFAAAIATARVAHAEESDHDRAVALFADARKLIDIGDCKTAIPKLEESIAREPSIGARFSLADCTRDADPIAAYWHLREAALLAWVKHDDRFASAEEGAAAIAARTGGVRFDVDAVDLRASGFDLRIDDRFVDRFHLAGPVAVPPGDHRIVASVADGRRYEGEARVTGGAVTLVRVVLLRGAGNAAAVPSTTAPASRNALADERGVGLSARRSLSLGIGAAGLATLAVATGFGIVALEKQGELDRACNGDRTMCTGDARVVDPVIDSADKNATISTILFAVGGALVAGGIVLWLTEPTTKAPKNAAVLRW